MRIPFNRSSSRVTHSGITGRTHRLVLLLVCVSLLMITLDNGGVLGPVKGQVQARLVPVERLFTQIRLQTRTGVETLIGSHELRHSVADLEREVTELREANIRLQGLQSENNRLKLELGVRQTYGWMTKPATVVQANVTNGRRIVRIDRGRVHGVAVGMAVVGKEGGSPAALIGTVDVVYAQTSDVLLVTDYGSAISAHTTQPEQAKGLVVGQWQLGTRIKLVDVDPNMSLAVDDYVVTSGLSKALATDTPVAQVLANIPIGVVTRVDRTNHVQIAEVRPFVDPDRVRTVWVITGQR